MNEINTLFGDTLGDMLKATNKLAARGMNALKTNGNDMVGRSAPIEMPNMDAGVQRKHAVQTNTL